MSSRIEGLNSFNPATDLLPRRSLTTTAQRQGSGSGSATAILIEAQNQNEAIAKIDQDEPSVDAIKDPTIKLIGSRSLFQRARNGFPRCLSRSSFPPSYLPSYHSGWLDRHRQQRGRQNLIETRPLHQPPARSKAGHTAPSAKNEELQVGSNALGASQPAQNEWRYCLGQRRLIPGQWRSVISHIGS